MTLLSIAAETVTPLPKIGCVTVASLLQWASVPSPSHLLSSGGAEGVSEVAAAAAMDGSMAEVAAVPARAEGVSEAVASAAPAGAETASRLPAEAAPQARAKATTGTTLEPLVSTGRAEEVILESPGGDGPRGGLSSFWVWGRHLSQRCRGSPGAGCWDWDENRLCGVRDREGPSVRHPSARPGWTMLGTSGAVPWGRVLSQLSLGLRPRSATPAWRGWSWAISTVFKLPTARHSLSDCYSPILLHSCHVYCSCWCMTLCVLGTESSCVQPCLHPSWSHCWESLFLCLQFCGD